MLKVSNLSVKRGDKVILENVNFDVHEHKLISLVGPSGCGKSTLLHTIVGFIQPLKGEVSLHGKNLIDVPIEKRSIGIVFQDDTLFPNLTVRENVGYGVSTWEEGHRNKRIDELLELVNLQAHETKLPHELSGGEKQRVALIRALAPQPKLLLMDESFSSLDPILRSNLRDEIKGILKDLSMTCILVTHDRDEAMNFSDEVIVLNAGKVEQVGTPSDLYIEPANEFVANFFGSGNLVKEGQCNQVSGGYYHDIEIAENEGTEALIKNKSFSNGLFYYDVAILNSEVVFCNITSKKKYNENSSIFLKLSAPWKLTD